MRFLKPDQIDEHESTIVRLLLPVVVDACHGEFTIDDILARAKEGRMHIGISEHPEMCGAFEFRHYPQFMAVNILALGGRDLHRFMDRVLPTFRQWAGLAGAERIEASCSEAMARMLMRGGFQKDYVQVSIPVRDLC